ncbi:uncharacterized protein LOC121869908 [Homarus americanus]|uniref:Uncharacterized protein n=1 Tax=Homarus americanus TaxID=6706 RepID=A0A8J5MVI1_HOMAM|nr:uncharacterized protein LOC121869908 [Homarus americanus]KAG7165980.1 hypothetical protein Hamer_G011903 [Homarus americanus]
MAFKGMLVFLLLAGVITLVASENTKSQNKKRGEEGRFLFTTDENQSITIGTASLTTLALLGVVAVLAAAAAIILLPQDDASSGYASATSAYGATAIHRSLDDAAAKYEQTDTPVDRHAR